MNDNIMTINNHSNTSWYDHNDGPSLHTRIVFAITWIFIAVAGIIGKEKPFFFICNFILCI
jgi:hypothetical protein